MTTTSGKRLIHIFCVNGASKKKKWISQYLQQQIERGGFVVAAFDEDILIGFCSIDGYLLGKTAKYANMTMLFVDDRYKRKGIEKNCFLKFVAVQGY